MKKHDAKILRLPYTEDVIHNHMINLARDLASAEQDYIEPLLVVLLNWMQECEQMESSHEFHKAYENLAQALLWYRCFAEE